MDSGFLYIAIGKRYLMEAEISARSLKRFTKQPVCVITDEDNYENKIFDKVILEKLPADFVAKIMGMKLTPFERTVFLDNDTFVCDDIDLLFSILDVFDFGLTIENFMHSYGFLEKYNPGFKIRFEKLIPEFHTGVIVYRANNNTSKFFNDWLHLHHEMKVKADMPTFREAYLDNIDTIKIATLPFEYNYHGTFSLGFAYNKIKIIHDRLGTRWNTLTTVMLPFDKMDKFAKRINKFEGKRVILPYIGVIPYSYNLYRIKFKIKRFFGIKKTKKAETF